MIFHIDKAQIEDMEPKLPQLINTAGCEIKKFSFKFLMQ